MTKNSCPSRCRLSRRALSDNNLLLSDTCPPSRSEEIIVVASGSTVQAVGEAADNEAYQVSVVFKTYSALEIDRLAEALAAPNLRAM